MDVKHCVLMTLAMGMGAAATAAASMECVAHRGYWSATVPENTVESIRRAYDFGANWVETDFNLMQDGSILCFHGEKGRALVKPPFHVATLAEILAVVPKDRHIQCEIKAYGPTYAEKFDAAVKAAGLTETNIIVSSFNVKALKDFKQRFPAYRTLYLFTVKEGVTAEAVLQTAKDAGVYALCPNAEQARKCGWTRAEADKIRAAGHSFRVYGVNSPEQLAYAHELGAEAFTCNSFEDAFLWAKRQHVALNPRAEKKVNLTAAFPDAIRTIGVVMPASIFAKRSFDAITNALVVAGYRVKVAPRINFKQVAPVADRARDLEEMWLDPEVDLVICARGGTGAQDVVPLVDWAKLRTRRQRFLGFSNITHLVNAMAKEDVGEPFSGSTLSHFRYCDMPTLTWLNRAIARAEQPKVALHALKPGAFSGKACGGHITIFRDAVKAHAAPSADGRVVYLECVHRPPRVVAQALDDLVQTGYFAKAAGVIFGDIHNKGDKEDFEPVKRAFAEKVSCPVYDGYPYGHVPRSFAIDFNRLHEVSADGVLTVR